MSGEIVVQIATDGSATRLDRYCRELSTELRRVRGISVSPVTTRAEPGQKAGIVQTIGVLAVSGLLSAATVKAVADVLTAYVHRSTAGTVTVRRGEREVVVEGLAPDSVAQVTEQIQQLLGDEE